MKLLLLVLPFSILLSGCPMWNKMFGNKDSGLRPEAQECADNLDPACAVNAQVAPIGAPEQCSDHADAVVAAPSFEPQETNALAKIRVEEGCNLGREEFTSFMALNRYLNPTSMGGDDCLSCFEGHRDGRYGLLSIGDDDIHHNLRTSTGNNRAELIGQTKDQINSTYNQGLYKVIGQLVGDYEVKNCGVVHMGENGEERMSLLTYLGLEGVTENTLGDPEWEIPEILAERTLSLLNTKERLVAATQLNSRTRQEMFLASDVDNDGQHELTYRCSMNQPIRLSQMIAPRDRSALIFGDDVIDLMYFTPATTSPSTVSTRTPASAEPINFCID